MIMDSKHVLALRSWVRRHLDLQHLFALRPWMRHSLVLAVAGTVYCLFGLTYVLADATPSRQAALQLALHWVPLPVWGVVWIVVGLLAILSSRWPPASETWGYTTMTALAAAWAGVYAAGLLLGAPAQGVSGVLVWGLVAFMWWAVSGLVNPGSNAVEMDALRERVAELELAGVGELRERIAELERECGIESLNHHGQN